MTEVTQVWTCKRCGMVSRSDTGVVVPEWELELLHEPDCLRPDPPRLPRLLPDPVVPDIGGRGGGVSRVSRVSRVSAYAGHRVVHTVLLLALLVLVVIR